MVEMALIKINCQFLWSGGSMVPLYVLQLLFSENHSVLFLKFDTKRMSRTLCRRSVPFLTILFTFDVKISQRDKKDYELFQLNISNYFKP